MLISTIPQMMKITRFTGNLMVHLINTTELLRFLQEQWMLFTTQSTALSGSQTQVLFYVCSHRRHVRTTS